MVIQKRRIMENDYKIYSPRIKPFKVENRKEEFK